MKAEILQAEVAVVVVVVVVVVVGTPLDIKISLLNIPQASSSLVGHCNPLP